MKKSDYKQYLDPKEFAELYNEWAEKGKPTGNDPLYIKIWNGVTNAVRACIGALQARYHCKYRDYDEKVLDGTALMISRLIKLEGCPKNIVNMCYLPVLGVCIGPKAMQSDFEDSMASLDIPIEGRDTFADKLSTDSLPNY